MDSKIHDFLMKKLEKFDEKFDEIKDQNSNTKAILQAQNVREKQIQEELKKLSAQMEEHAKLLVESNRTLREYTRRTSSVEKRYHGLDERLQPIEKERKDRLAVEQNSQKMWKKIVALVSFIGALIGIGASLAKMGITFF